MERRMRRKVVRKSRAIRKRMFLLLTLTMMLCLGTLAMGAQSFNGNKVYYESVLIHSGDTLWDIALAYKGQDEKTEQVINRIMKFNNMSSANIRSGERIIVPVLAGA